MHYPSLSRHFRGESQPGLCHCEVRHLRRSNLQFTGRRLLRLQ